MIRPAHTPGPWKVFRTADGRTILGVGDRNAGGITDAGDVSTNDQGLWRSGKEKEANARLIAAAPELLEALDNLERYLRDTPHHNAVESAAARAAIAKAQGDGQ